MVKNPPCNAGATSLIPGPGKLRLCYNYWSPRAWSPGSATRQATTVRSLCTATRKTQRSQKLKKKKKERKEKLVKNINYFKQKLLNLCCRTLASELPQTNQMMCLCCWRGCLDWSIENITDIQPSANCNICAGSKIQSPEPDDPNLQLKDGRSPVLI